MSTPNTKKLGNKLLSYSIISVLLPILLFGFVAMDTIGHILDDKAQCEVDVSINSLEHALELKTTELSVSADYLTKTPGIINGITNRDESELLLRINYLKSCSGADFVGIVDSDGNLIASTAEDSVKSDIQNISKKLMDNNVQSSFEVLSEKTTYTIDNTSVIEDVNGSLSIVVLKPIFNENGQYIGSILVMDILNNNSQYISKVKEITGCDATISLGEKRIVTTLMNNGTFSMGSSISKDIWESIRSDEKIYHGTATVLGIPYITIYKPIYDSEKKVIGTISVGVLMSNAVMIKNEIRTKLILIAIFCTLITILISNHNNKKITRPILELKKGTEYFGQGNYNYKTNVKTGDELEILANSFNEMASQIKHKNEKLLENSNELKESYEKLRQLNKLRADIVSLISQEIRNPLTSIIGYVELVLDGTSGPINEKQKKYLQIANDNSIRLKKLVISMLDFSKMEKNIPEPHNGDKI